MVIVMVVMLSHGEAGAQSPVENIPAVSESRLQTLFSDQGAAFWIAKWLQRSHQKKPSRKQIHQNKMPKVEIQQRDALIHINSITY